MYFIYIKICYINIYIIYYICIYIYVIFYSLYLGKEENKPFTSESHKQPYQDCHIRFIVEETN